MTDLIIIGAGPGGYELAIEASVNGLSTILIEKNHLGGTCLNVGCIPTKTYYQNASVIKDIKKADTFGIAIENYSFDMKSARIRKDQVVESLRKGIGFALKKANVELIEGTARLVDKNTVEVNGQNYQAKYIVIATGSKSAIIPGFENALTSTEMLDLEEVPKHLAIIGGGVIGIEMASIFNLFGAEVDVIEYMDSIIPLADKEISKRLTMYLKKQGIKFHLSSKAKLFDNTSVTFEEKGKEVTIPTDKVLLSVGRLPNIEGLGLDEIGINYTKRGIETNHNFQTNIENIYAIGDVTGKQMLAHFATYSGYQVLDHILNKESNIRFDIVPACVFTFPEVAWVGITEEECKEKELEYTIKKGLYRANGKAVAMDEVDGFVKMILVQDEIKGVHIIGKDASVMIHEMSSLMNLSITTKMFKDFIHAHPTLSEILSMTIK